MYNIHTSKRTLRFVCDEDIKNLDPLIFTVHNLDLAKKFSLTKKTAAHQEKVQPGSMDNYCLGQSKRGIRVCPLGPRAMMNCVL